MSVQPVQHRSFSGAVEFSPPSSSGLETKKKNRWLFKFFVSPREIGDEPANASVNKHAKKWVTHGTMRRTPFFRVGSACVKTNKKQTKIKISHRSNHFLFQFNWFLFWRNIARLGQYWPLDCKGQSLHYDNSLSFRFFSLSARIFRVAPGPVALRAESLSEPEERGPRNRFPRCTTRFFGDRRRQESES